MANEKQDQGKGNRRPEQAAEAKKPRPPRVPTRTPLPEGLQSVVMRLEKKAGTLPRVMLKDLPSEGGPVIRKGGGTSVQSGEVFAHYQIMGEVARGGVGIVYKARDFDIGRDVAMKVLRDEFASDSNKVQRFLEEAQVAGQLQHPGILPIYAVGLRGGDQPFFTMKLIKGGTLQAALEDRSDPREQRRTYLGNFVQVCHAVGYAHARGVVHRDLKPANVLLGSHGEVQVMDWGLAKVLEQGGVADERRSLQSQQSHQSEISIIETVRTSDVGSHSLVGSVMGTPAYMPPEQAQGQVEHMTPQSDVFSLGGILCEILTGFPPYRDLPEMSQLAQAARGILKDGYQRLDACGADPALVELAKACLTPAQKARPKDGEAVAKAVADHLQSVEDRAHRSEIEAVQAREQQQAAQQKAADARALAAEERKARRLTAGLAGVAVLLILVGGGAWVWIQNDRQARAGQAERTVAAHLETAMRLASDARSNADDLSAWAPAIAEARKAEALITTGDTTDETNQHVTEVIADLKAERDAAQETVAAQLRDAKMVARLEDLASQKGPELDPKRLDAAYGETFRNYGLDLDEGETGLLAGWIRRSPIAEALVAALDDWGWLRRRYQTSANRFRDRPSEVAKQADEDMWRNQVRDAVLREDERTLSLLAGNADVRNKRVSTLQLLGGALGRAGKPAAAVEFFRRVHAAHPDDFWTNFNLGYWLSKQGGGEWGEAVRFYTAAAAVRPRSAGTWNNLGIALQESDRIDDAIQAYRRALDIEKDLATAHNNLATALLAKGMKKDALVSFESAIAIQDEMPAAWFGMGNAHFENGEFKKAVTSYQRAIQQREVFPEAQAQLLKALVKAGEGNAALEKVRSWSEDQPNSVWAQHQIANIHLARGNYPGAIEALERVVNLEPTHAIAWHDLGSALARLQAWDEARYAYDEAIKLMPEDARFHFDLGWATINAGDFDAAMAELETAIRLDPTLAEAHDELGALYVNMGKHREAERSYLRALEHQPQATYAHGHLGALYGYSLGREEAIKKWRRNVEKPGRLARTFFLSSLASALYSRALFPEAEKTCLEAIGLSPSNTSLHETLGRILAYRLPYSVAVARYETRTPGRDDKTRAAFFNGMGIGLWARGHVEEARQAWTTTLEKSPESAVHHNNLGLTLTRLGEYAMAQEEVEEALRISPYYLGAHSLLGRLLVHTVGATRVRSEYEAIVGDTPKVCRAYFLNGVGTELYRQSETEAALLTWREVDGLNMQADALAKNAIAVHHLGLDENVDEALVQLVEAVPKYPRHLQLNSNLGYALGLSTNGASAKARYSTVLARPPGYVESAFLLGLGQALVGRGDLGGAERIIRESLALKSDYIPASRLLVHVLWRSGQFEEAEKVAAEVLARQPYATGVRAELGHLRATRGDHDGALEALDKVCEHNRLLPDVWLARAEILGDVGRWEESRESASQAAHLARFARSWWNQPYQDWVMSLCVRLAPRGSDRRGVVTSEEKRLDLAYLAMAQGKELEAAEHFESALGKDPNIGGDPARDTLRRAAVAALRAGSTAGPAADRLSAKKRAVWRNRGMLWLQAEVARLVELLNREDRRTRQHASTELGLLLVSHDLGPVRDDAALPHLPEDEAEAWRRLWRDVRTELERHAERALRRE